MNTALILAAGTDARFQMDVPKQFVNVNNRPLFVFKIENLCYNLSTDCTLLQTLLPVMKAERCFN